MKLPTFGAYLLKDLTFDRSRSILTVISLAAVIVSYLAASAIADVFQKYGNQPQTGSSEILLMSDFALEPMQSKLDDGTLQTAAGIVRQRFGPDSVLSAFPVIYRTLEINDRALQVMAVPRDNLISGYRLVLQKGDWPASDDQVVITQEAMQLNGWRIGDRIPIRDSSLLITGQLQEEAGTSVIWMLYSGGQKLFNVQTDFQIGVLEINEALDLPTVQSELEQDAQFPKGYAAYLNQQLYGRYTDLVHDLIRVALILSGLALLVIVFGTFNAASLTMTERKQDIAILQTVGFRSRAILLLLLGRTLFQALLAFLLAWGIVAIIVKDSLKYPVDFFAKTAVLRLSPETVLLGFLLTMASASLGVWLTVRAQGSQSLADQLRE